MTRAEEPAAGVERRTFGASGRGAHRRRAAHRTDRDARSRPDRDGRPRGADPGDRTSPATISKTPPRSAVRRRPSRWRRALADLARTKAGDFPVGLVGVGGTGAAGDPSRRRARRRRRPTRPDRGARHPRRRSTATTRRAVLARVTAKTLIMNGQQDPDAAAAAARWHHDRLPGSRVEMVPGSPGASPDGRLSLADVWDRVLSHVAPGTKLPPDADRRPDRRRDLGRERRADLPRLRRAVGRARRRGRRDAGGISSATPTPCCASTTRGAAPRHPSPPTPRTARSPASRVRSGTTCSSSRRTSTTCTSAPAAATSCTCTASCAGRCAPTCGARPEWDGDLIDRPACPSCGARDAASRRRLVRRDAVRPRPHRAGGRRVRRVRLDRHLRRGLSGSRLRRPRGRVRRAHRRAQPRAQRRGRSRSTTRARASRACSCRQWVDEIDRAPAT